MDGLRDVTVPEPDQDQALVIDAAASVRMLVTAGPGSGKTWTAARRLAALARRRGVDDEAGLLALAFSRAAAAAMTAALARAGVRQFVEVRTLDSWTTSLMRSRWRANDESALEHFETLSYDGRIGCAFQALGDGSLELPRYSHIVVDEAQDLFGDRAELTMALLSAPATAGWTVLGDRAQSIFEFDADGTKSLLDLVEQSSVDVLRRELTTCHRTTSDALLGILETGTNLRLAAPAPGDLIATREKCLSLRQLSEAEFVTAAPSYIGRGEHSAVLFRDNRRLLALSERLSEHGIEHRIASGRAESLAPGWLADINGSGDNSISEDDARAAVPSGLDADVVLESLRIVCRRGRGRLEVQKVADAISMRMLPEPLLQEAPTGVVLSTVHRAKGLEFCRVLVTPGIWEKAGEAVDEARTLFVAMTRAVTTLIRLSLAEPKQTTRPDRVRNRFAERSFNRGNIVAIELVSADIDWRCPRHTLTERVHHFETMRLGDEVLLERDERSALPSWKLLSAAGHDLGRTVPAFGEVALALLGTRPSEGSRFAGGRVTGFTTLPLAPGSLPDRRQLVRCPVIRGMISHAK